jgi:hypothetical protein
LRNILFNVLNVCSLCEEIFQHMGQDDYYHYVNMRKLPRRKSRDKMALCSFRTRFITNLTSFVLLMNSIPFQFLIPTTMKLLGVYG